MDYLKRGAFADEPFPNETIIETARRLVVWHYQWIVRNEFLKWFVLPEILTDIEQNGPRFFKPVPGEEIRALPIEFTQAAFRFGHSMVQPQYEINRWVGLIRLSDLVRKTRPNEPGETLLADIVVNGDRFPRIWDGITNYTEKLYTLN